MNQQLKQQLIEQAGFHIRPGIENTVPGIDWNCGSYGYDQCVDRLIELVVKECADVAGYYYTRNETVTPKQIKAHFGVKE